MPGDEVHEEAGASAFAAPDADSGSTAGPRHAAPRKPLLTRLHVPAGKAIAIAAMPSAVLMGMGLTPQLAHAKPIPKNPFGSGPCVSQQDKDSEAVEEEALKAEKEKAEKEKAAKEKAEAEKKEEAEKDSESPSPTPSSPSTEPSESAPPAEDEESAEPEEEKNPLDPLGLGDRLKDAFTPEEEKAQEAEESAAPEPSSTPQDEASAGTDVADKAEETAGKVEDGVKDTTDKLKQGAEDTGDKLSGKDAAGADASATGEDGKKAFPCVEEKKSEGKDEQTAATLPNDPWQLEATSLGLHGLDYKGVVNVKTANGQTKQALKFTADSLDIGDLHQTVRGPDGNTYHVQAAKGSTSTIKGGQVTMYTEELKGNLFGLIPITFDPEHPPPLNIAEAYFTKVKVTQAGQFGGDLTIPGLHQYVD